MRLIARFIVGRREVSHKIRVGSSYNPGEEIAPPPFDPRGAWHAAIEERLLGLLGVLDENARIEVDRLTVGLNGPEATVAPEPRPKAFKRGNIWLSGDGAAGGLLSTLVAADYWASASARSFWRTNGGSATCPIVYVRNSLPDPFSTWI
jgi:hypothetical protein